MLTTHDPAKAELMPIWDAYNTAQQCNESSPVAGRVGKWAYRFDRVAQGYRVSCLTLDGYVYVQSTKE